MNAWDGVPVEAEPYDPTTDLLKQIDEKRRKIDDMCGELAERRSAAVAEVERCDAEIRRLNDILERLFHGVEVLNPKAINITPNKGWRAE